MTSLRQRFIEDMQVRNFSPVTQASYTREVSGFARYFNKSPELLGPEQIRAYQVYLTNERKLGVVSISVATSALRFLYRVTLKKNWCMADIVHHLLWPGERLSAATPTAWPFPIIGSSTSKMAK